MNSAAVVNNAPEVIQPEQSNMMSYPEFWEKHNMYGTISPDDQLMVRIMNFFTGEGKRVRDEYANYQENYLNNLNARNEAKAVQSARAWDEFMSNTAYTRSFKDLENAGVNPYLLLNSGATPAASVGSSSKPDYSYSKPSHSQTQSNNKGRDLALIMLAIARIVAAL